MLNANGVLAILDRAITLNWEDGATMHRITAQVRYHTQNSASTQVLRVSAGRKASDDPLTLISVDPLLQATWRWQFVELLGAPLWQVSLDVLNRSEEDVYLDSMDVLRVDAAFGGLFNLGAPPGLWRCARENALSVFWDNWGDGTNSATGFARSSKMLIQPSMSNRSTPPAVLMATLAQNPSPTTGMELAVPLPEMRTELVAEMSGEKFERLFARVRTDGALLGVGAAIASPVFLIVSGDDAAELWAL